MTRQRKLFRKYATLIVSLVGGALVVSGAMGLRFAYHETRNALLLLEREKAYAAALKIEQFTRDIEQRLEWTTFDQHASGANANEQRRQNLVRLQRLIPAVMEVSYLDGEGREQVRLSRLVMDVIGSGVDHSANPYFAAARKHGSYFSPIYFRKGSEPYMTVAVRAARGGNVTVAEVNLKFIWDVITQIRIGKTGHAYVVGNDGMLIAHPDISLVLQRTSMATQPQVQAVLEGDLTEIAGHVGNAARDIGGRQVLAAYARIPPLGWTVFVEQPLDEALAPLYASMLRNLMLLVAGLALAALASLLLARRMARPIEALRVGAASVGSGDLDHRIEIATNDELQELAEQFNDMAAKLHESYAGLEDKVKQRTAELAAEQARTKELLHSILPAKLAEELARTGTTRPVRHESVSILFTDFCGFTQASSTMPPDRMVAELNEIFAEFDRITQEEGVEKIKTIGDAYMAAAGVPIACADHAHRCVKTGIRMLAYLNNRNQTATFKWALRIGIHSGPVVAGVVGTRKYAFDIWGDTVNIASRMESSGEVGKLNVSAYTYDLIRDNFDCEYRGKVTAKGKGEVDMYFVLGARK